MPVLTPDMVHGLVYTGASARVDVDVDPGFSVGAQVTTRNINPVGHTRLPRYARGKHGVIECDRGVFVFPDTNAHGKGETPQHIYSVCFTAQELWGSEASARDTLRLDIWEDYLEPA